MLYRESTYGNVLRKNKHISFSWQPTSLEKSIPSCSEKASGKVSGTQKAENVEFGKGIMLVLLGSLPLQQQLQDPLCLGRRGGTCSPMVLLA